MTNRTPWWVRGGLRAVRMLVWGKNRLFRVGAVANRLFVPGLRKAVFFLAVPLYRGWYAGGKFTRELLKPAKHRFMFLLCNRATTTVAASFAVVLAVLGNVSFAQARVSMFDFGTRSLLYGIMNPTDRHEIFEETVGVTPGEQAVSSYGTEVALRATPAASLPQGFLVASAATDVAALVPMGEEPVPPRTEAITYQVASGDTLSTIAEHFGISLNTLLWANNLTQRSTLRIGQSLRILPVTGVEHSVARNQTLSSIAKMYGVDVAVLREANRLGESDTLTVGAKLMVPGGQIRTVASPIRPNAPIGDVLRTPAPPSSGTGSKPADGASMIWPTDLHYIVRGLKWGHTGVDIDCNGHSDGTSTNDNYAAAGGVVQYAGWKRGYGNTVEIDHGGGVVTRYGHFHALYVNAGDTVSSGQALGRCGSTGNSSGTHLHFEVITNGRFMNPLDYVR